MMRKNKMKCEEIDNSKLKFYIDVRESQSLAAAMRGADYIFHAAA